MSLYETLGVARDATEKAIKVAYLQRARIEHPDKNPGDAGAHERFQALGRAYSILRDPERRKLYDASGHIDEGPTVGEAQWTAFWNDFYERVTTERIDALASEYRGSEEEREDLRAAYLEAKGDMGGIIDRMMFSTADDEPRYRDTLDGWVRDGSLRRFKAFEAEPAGRKKARAKRAAKEAEEAEELARVLGLRTGGGDDALRAALVSRQAQRRDTMLDSLATKYGGGSSSSTASSSKAKGKKASDPFADDAAFEAAQRRMLSGISKGKR